MNKNLKSVVVMGLVLGLGACSSMESKKDYKPAKIKWTKSKAVAFDPTTKANLPPNTTNLVFFREKDGKDKDTSVNIAINNRYQTSVRGGNYTSVVTCAGGNTISTAITKKLLNNLTYNKHIYDFTPKSNAYFEVMVDAQGNATTKRVDEATALQKMADNQLQTHMVNRVYPKNCRNFEPRKPDPIVSEPKKLFGVYYFDFNAKALTVAEKQRVFNMGKEIVATGQTYTVYLSGHTDPVGNETYNKALSRKRAIQVAEVLEQAGVDGSRVKLGSFGESQPVILTCDGIKTTSSRNGCNLKNRRVELVVKMD